MVGAIGLGGGAVDELQQQRDRRADQDTARDGSQVGQLATRDREAKRQDDVAEGRDDAAKVADRDADARDRAAEHRDAEADARDADASTTTGASLGDRRRTLRAREDAAYDRELSADDRGRARRDRQVSQRGRERASGDRSAAWEAVAAIRLMLSDAEDDDIEDALLIGRAQGIIMQERGLPPTEALLELCAQSARNATSLAGGALHIVGDTSLGMASPRDASESAVVTVDVVEQHLPTA